MTLPLRSGRAPYEDWHHIVTFFFLRLFFLLAISSFFNSQSFDAQISPSVERTSDAQVLTFVGCYDLKLGRWWPWANGEDTAFVTPPTHIELLSLRGIDGFENDFFLIRTVPSPKLVGSGRRVASFWQLKSKTQLTLTWTDGFVGVSLNLEKQGDELRGWAHPHFDSPRLVARTAHVTARKIPCTTSQENPGGSY